MVIFLSLVPVVYIRARDRWSGNEVRELQALFESGDFEGACAQSGELLEQRPMDLFLLTLNGFSSYQLAISQINSFDTLSYIDNSIWALRRAMLLKEGAFDGRILYVLGKAYYHKGSDCADLAVRYLNEARAAGFTAPDIPEYLGLAYAALRDYTSSIAAFSQSMAAEEGRGTSDVLLLSIARSYFSLNELESAKTYLVRCLEVSMDSRTRTTARLLLGDILFQTGEISGAEAELLAIIAEGGENADVRYQLGVLYASMGDTTRARAEWRSALRIDPAHSLARNRLM
ncbi:MAG: tetratricopeptide repeat protein [Treponema sp.]|nr:tetratricopeptide repeat protein [Treponema sp.]